MPYTLVFTVISIHALREEGDRDLYRFIADFGMISIHALREEGDKLRSATLSSLSVFLSTPSARRATQSNGEKIWAFWKFLSTPSARRATRTSAAASKTSPFLSTPSARRATRKNRPVRRSKGISIHALREEGDKPKPQQHMEQKHFYPRPPRGGRPSPRSNRGVTKYFYPRPPRGGRPLRNQIHCRMRGISIHALREEGDAILSESIRERDNFYPRPPRGGRQQKQRQNLYFQTNYTTFCTNLEEP